MSRQGFCNEDYLHELINRMEINIYEINAYYINHGYFPCASFDDSPDASRAKTIRQIIEVRDELNKIRRCLEGRFYGGEE